jgi:hypothetical protein
LDGSAAEGVTGDFVVADNDVAIPPSAPSLATSFLLSLHLAHSATLHGLHPQSGSLRARVRAQAVQAVEAFGAEYSFNKCPPTPQLPADEANKSRLLKPPPLLLLLLLLLVTVSKLSPNEVDRAEAPGNSAPGNCAPDGGAEKHERQKVAGHFLHPAT